MCKKENYLELNIISFNIRCCDDRDGNSIAERAPRLSVVTSLYDADLSDFRNIPLNGRLLSLSIMGQNMKSLISIGQSQSLNLHRFCGKRINLIA